MPGTWLEASGDHLAEDRNDVGPVQGNGASVENTGDSGVGTETNQVDSDTPEDAEPDGVDGSAGAVVRRLR